MTSFEMSVNGRNMKNVKQCWTAKEWQLLYQKVVIIASSERKNGQWPAKGVNGSFLPFLPSEIMALKMQK